MNQQTHADSRNLNETFDEFNKLHKILTGDIKNILERYEGYWEDQTMRRMFVRAVWAAIEGEIYGLKTFIVHACILSNVSLDADEHIFLSEFKFVIDGDGIAKKEFVHTRTVGNIKRIFKIAGELFPSWKPDFSGSGWQDICASLEVRHRITHPKGGSELMISDDEFNQLQEAYGWYGMTFDGLFQQLN